MIDQTDPRDWIARAEEDYELAKSALRRKKPLLYGATFHAQQCVEKYLKALLVAKGKLFPKIHDLVALNDLCKQNGVILGVNEDIIRNLTAYAVEIRYLGEQPTFDEAADAVKTARNVRLTARKLLKI
jgi:HEPN domain-containing protein